jgi:hypothetical protein
LEICSISSSYNFTSSIRSDENQFRQFVWQEIIAFISCMPSPFHLLFCML